MSEGLASVLPGANLPPLSRMGGESRGGPAKEQPLPAIPQTPLARLGDAHGRDPHKMDQILSLIHISEPTRPY